MAPPREIPLHAFFFLVFKISIFRCFFCSVINLICVVLYLPIVMLLEICN